MSCTHRAPDRYVEQVWDWWTGATELVRVEGASTQVDISVGAWQCTQCGEVGYYTGNWKRYYEEGTPCAGSGTAPRKLRNAAISGPAA